MKIDKKSNIMTPAIVLSSHTMGLGVIRSLGIKGVPIISIYYEKSDMGYVSKYVKEKIFAPHPERYEDKFVDLLVECSKRFGRSLIIPADDATLLVVSKHKSLLEQHHIVACTEWRITKQFIDKKHTYALAETVGVPAPRTIVPRSIEDVERYSGIIDYPCLVKPCQSHRYFELFGKKMVKVENHDQMLSAYQQASDAGIEVMLQEFIPGDDTQGVNYNSYFWKGKPLVEFTAEKVRYSPPQFGVPRVVISKNIPEVIEPARKLLQAMGFYGYCCTEFKKDARDGMYKLMEVNGRHNRSTLLSVSCGINFPWIEYQHLTQKHLPSACSYKAGIYWIDELRDVIHTAKYRKTERYSLAQYIRPYLKKHTFAIFDVKDPKPFIKRCIDLVKMFFSHFSYLFKGELKLTLHK
jgi:predicted ATP-grasp superfamily ATP-dependent carboligase